MKRHLVIPIVIFGVLSACVSQAAERSGDISTAPVGDSAATPGGLVLVGTNGGIAAADMSTRKVLFNEKSAIASPDRSLVYSTSQGALRVLDADTADVVDSFPAPAGTIPIAASEGGLVALDRRWVRDLSPRGGRATVHAGRCHGHRERRHAAPEPAWELRARSLLHRRSKSVPHPVPAGRGARSLSSDGARPGQRADLPSREPRQGSPQLDAGDATAAGVGARPKRALHALHQPGLIRRSPDLRARAQPDGEVGALHRSAGVVRVQQTEREGDGWFPRREASLRDRCRHAAHRDDQHESIRWSKRPISRACLRHREMSPPQHRSRPTEPSM